MPFNGSGVFQRVRNWVADATAGIKIRADYHDAEDDGFAAGLSNCITRDGQTTINQNIPFNSKRVTGLADPLNPQDAATKAYADTKLTSGGGAMSGDLAISKGSPSLTLNSTDAGGSNILGQKSGKSRWWLRIGNNTAETGANAGSDFDLYRYADDGVQLLGQSLMINRASGAWTITGALAVSGAATINGTVTINGDIHASRAASEGVVYLGSDGTHYLYWNGSAYTFPNGKLTLGAQGTVGNDAVTWDQLNTKQANLGFTPIQQGGGASQATNKVYIGWSGAALRAQVDNSDLGAFVFAGGQTDVSNARLAYAGDPAIVSAPQLAMYEPYPGAVVTGWQWQSVSTPVVTYLRFRYLQMYTSSWFTVGYV